MWARLKESRLFGDAFWALLGSVGSALVLLLGTRLLTELITPAVYGEVALLIGLVALGVSVFSYPFICAGMRLVAECWHPWQRSGLYKAVTGLVVRATLLAMMLLAVAGATLAYLGGSDAKLFLLAGLLLAVTVKRELGVQLLIGERRHRRAGLWQMLDSMLRPTAAIASVWWLGGQAEWVLLGYSLATLLAAVIGSIGRNGSNRNDRDDGYNSEHFRQQLWSYALPLMPTELIFWLNGLGDRYVIEHLLNAADVGLYAAVYTLVNEAFNRSAMVLLRVFQPAYFQANAQGRMQEGFSLLWLWIASVAGLGIVGVSLVRLSHDWLAALVLAESYHAAAALMPAIAIGVALHALGTVLAQPLLARKQTRLILAGRSVGALTAAVSIPLMVSHYGLAGAAWANSIYFGVETLTLTVLARPWRILDTATVTTDAKQLNAEATA